MAAEMGMALPVMTVLTGAMDYAAKSASATAMLTAAAREKLGADSAAKQLRINAGQQEAAAQFGAVEVQRKGDYDQSRIRAMVAMQGGNSSDPTIVGLRARMVADAAVRASNQIYQGAEAARAMRDKANTTEYMGDATMADAKAAKGAADLARGASALKTGAQTMMFGSGPKSMATKYNFPDIDAGYTTSPQYTAWGE